MARDRGVYRGVFSALPDDPDFQRLSPNARLVLYTCRVCKQAGPAVIFRYYPELLAKQTGLRPAALEAALQELEQGVWIARDGVVLWVRNGLRYDPYMNLSNAKHAKSVIRALEELPRVPLILKFCDYYQIAYPFDTHSIGLPTSASPSTEYRVPKKTEYRVPSESAPAPPAPAADPHANGHAVRFRIPEAIDDALRRAPRIGAEARIRTAEFWQAELRANPGVDFPAEILKAEAWLRAHPERHYKRLSGFVHNWLARADRES